MSAITPSLPLSLSLSLSLSHTYQHIGLYNSWIITDRFNEEQLELVFHVYDVEQQLSSLSGRVGSVNNLENAKTRRFKNTTGASFLSCLPCKNASFLTLIRIDLHN